MNKADSLTPFTNPPAHQAAAKCEATLKRVREVKKGYNYEMRMSLKNDPRRFEYAEVHLTPLFLSPSIIEHHGDDSRPATPPHPFSPKTPPPPKKQKQKLKQADERLAALETELKWAKSEADKKSLFKGAKEGAGVQGLGERSTNDDYLKEAKRLQDKTEGALQNALEMVEATKKVGWWWWLWWWATGLMFWAGLALNRTVTGIPCTPNLLFYI